MTDEQRENFEFVKSRIVELQQGRQTQFGTNIETIWKDADENYIPHRLGTTGRRVLVADEEKGLRSSYVTIGGDKKKWQSDISQPNPFIKIQIALSILVDQNPTAVFNPGAKKYQKTTQLIQQLYKRSWEVGKSKQQLKLFVHNLAKYGWGCARTYPLLLQRNVRNLVEYNQEEPDKSVWENKTVTEFNDVYRENLDPWNVWVDDTAKPNNEFSIRDWCFRKVYPYDTAKEEFGRYKFWKHVTPGGTVTKRISGKVSKQVEEYQEKDLVEIYFYENRIRDLLMVIANNTPIVIEPLPISDEDGVKKLSLWQTYWQLRNTETIYGVGIYEAIRYEHALLDRIRNMTVDQLTLSIRKSFFYQGTEGVMEGGTIEIEPGVGKQVIEPQKINWVEVPGPGREAWEGIDRFKASLDEASGITDPLMGVVTGKTAFEIAQSKESALKRLKIPLDNIIDALEQEGYISIAVMQTLYSIPEVYSITDPQLIEEYLKEIGSDPELYDENVDTFGNRIIKTRVPRELPLTIEEDNEGNLIETKEIRFLRVKPKYLKWSGVINIKAQSILTPSKQLDKALTLEMYNLLIPILAQPPQLYGKIAKDIIKLYDKDPKDILSEEWMNEQSQDNRLIVPLQGMQQGIEAARFVPRIEVPANPRSEAQRLIARASAPLRS